MLNVSFSLFVAEHLFVKGETFLSPLTSIYDYVIMICIVCHLDILRLPARYNRVIWLLSSSSLCKAKKKKNIRENRFYKMSCIYLTNKTVNVWVQIHDFIKCNYPTAFFDQFPKLWRWLISERHQQLEPKCKYIDKIIERKWKKKCEFNITQPTIHFYSQHIVYEYSF